MDRTAITANAPKTTLDPRENRPARDGNGLRPDRLGDAGGQGQVETGDGSGVPVGLDGDEPGVLFADAVVGGEHLLVGGGEGPAEAVAQGEGLGGVMGQGWSAQARIAVTPVVTGTTRKTLPFDRVVRWGKSSPGSAVVWLCDPRLYGFMLSV